MEQEKYALVRRAILERKQIVAMYDTHPREMCPHVLGRKDGSPQALFYQFGGESSSRPIGPPGATENWRCMFISDLSDVEVRDGPWYTAANHSQMQSCVDDVDVKVTA